MADRSQRNSFRSLSAFVVVVCLAVSSCAQSEGYQVNMWGYPRLVSRAEAEALILEVQNAIRQNGAGDCSPVRDFGYDDEVTPMVLDATPADIVDYGHFSLARYGQAIEVLLKGPNWPDAGFSVVIFLQDLLKNRKCAGYALSEAVLVESQ